MSLIYKTGTAVLRRLPAERAHTTTVKLLRAGFGPKSPAHGKKGKDTPGLAINLGGLNLPNPVGLAAGFDKDCDVPDAMLGAGFGFVECGTVTPKPQAGNPKPRLFRLTEDEAVINRMGFNNRGLEHFDARLTARHGRGGIVGANLGANKDSDDRAADYVTGLERLWGKSDYFTINISSPNTPGLRKLQGADAMDNLLGQLMEKRIELTGDKPSFPMFLKVAPDLDFADVERVVEQARQYGMDAIIVSNTTIARPDSLKSAHKGEGGGLSGQPLFEKSTEILREFYAASQGSIDLIGVGGISNGAQAYAKIRAGAKAVQLYSALVYHGPQLVTQICEDLSARLKADGFDNIAQAVGADKI